MLELYFTQIDTVNLTRGQISNAESRMGKELLAYTLKAFHGIGVLPPIDISESGKPFFADHSFEFNISHSHGRVVLALSDKPVGVDIEHSGRAIPELVRRRFFKDGEATVEDWTRFESYSKLSGEGIYSAVYPPVEKDVFFKSYTISDNYVVSVCTHTGSFPRKIVKNDLGYRNDYLHKYLERGAVKNSIFTAPQKFSVCPGNSR